MAINGVSAVGAVTDPTGGVYRLDRLIESVLRVFLAVGVAMRMGRCISMYSGDWG